MVVERTFIPGHPNDIVQDHILSKLMEPILPVEPCDIDVIDVDDVIFDFIVLECIYKYILIGFFL